MRFVVTFFRANRFLSGVWLLLMVSCTSVIPYHQSQVEISDQQMAPYPPQPLELIEKQDFIVFANFPPSLNAQQEQFFQILKEQILEHGHLQQVADSRIQYAKKPLGTLKNTKDLLKLGLLLKTKYIASFEWTKPTRKGVDAFVKIKIYRVFPENLLLQIGVDLKKEQIEKLKKGLKLRVQQALPQRGFILETKANKTWIQISLGKQDQIGINRRLTIYRRNIEQSTSQNITTMEKAIDEEKPAMKVTTTTEKKEQLSEVGQAIVKFVKERHAYALVKESDRHRVLNGDVVVVLPE